MSALTGSLVATLPEILAYLSGSIGVKVWRNTPESELVSSILEGVRRLRGDGEIKDKGMGQVVTTGWTHNAFRPEKVSATGNSGRQVLAPHDAETINSHKSQKQIGK